MPTAVRSDTFQQCCLCGISYAEVNIIMGFELMTDRNKPIVELLYGSQINDKNKV